ncbi:MAG TPA: NADH-quinone oxidoreductase subunit N [Bacteroidales bacterium]|nr:NADH-quinone oxidoreductase subunit N [Bacteroidales bacterium]
MIQEDFLCLSPFIIVAGTPVLLMLVIAFTRHFRILFGISLVGLSFALLSVYFLLPVLPHTLGQLFIFDGFSILFFGLIIFTSLLITILSYRYVMYQDSEKEEFLIMLFTAVLGSLILAASANFATLFLGLETLSISLYVLIAYRRSRGNSIEASVKYLILASVSSAFLLFGMGLIYAGTGSLEFTRIGQVLHSADYSTPLLLAGFSMMLVGIGFKLALVPFHMWTPDVYQGAPVPVTTFIATVSKGAVMAFLLRFFKEIQGNQNHNFILMITVIALLSMFTGNLLAIRQRNVKRILAYSSIANMGYLLVTLLVSNTEGLQAAVFYIVSYMVTTLGAFGVINLLASRDHDADDLEDYRGLFWKHPSIALVFTLALLSLAGIPLTAGFIGKFYLVFTGIHSGLWLLVTGLILNSVIGLYYYLRVISTLFSPVNAIMFPGFGVADRIVLGFTALGIVWLGIFPGGFLRMIAHFTGL